MAKKEEKAITVIVDEYAPLSLCHFMIHNALHSLIDVQKMKKKPISC